MGVRVPVELQVAGAGARSPRIVTPAVANTGFETKRPEILLPRRLAESLRLMELRGRSVVVRVYQSPAGEFEVARLPRALRVRLASRGAPTRTLIADATISESETEAVLNDIMVERLGVVILEPARGTWVLLGESLLHRRSSARRRLW